MVLVDASIWIDHFRSSNEGLRTLLIEGLVVMHPLVVGELACGNLHRRQVTLSLLDSLPIAKVVSDYEARCQIETMKLFGAGMGFADVHLLSSCQLSGCLLWTKDRALIAVAEKLGIAYMPPI